MSLRGDVAEHHLRTRGPRCSVAAIADALGAADRADLFDLLADDGVQSSALARALTARGHRVSTCTMARHRRGDCRCEPV